MNQYEEDLQRKIEQRLAIDRSLDSLAYGKVFKALRQETDFQLNTSFADSVILHLVVSKPKKSHDHIWLATGIVTFFIATAISAALTHFKIDFGVLSFISNHLGLIIFGLGFILGIHLLDKKITNKTLKLG